MEKSRLTRDGTAEPVSRDQILRHARGQGNVHFPCSADHEQDWQPYPVDPYSAICDDHTYIHTYILPRITRALANSGFAFEGTTVFRRGIATGGIPVFRSRMLPLFARRRRDCLKLMLSVVCCDKFLTLWDLVNSVFEVSFWRKP